MVSELATLAGFGLGLIGGVEDPMFRFMFCSQFSDVRLSSSGSFSLACGIKCSIAGFLFSQFGGSCTPRLSLGSDIGGRGESKTSDACGYLILESSLLSLMPLEMPNENLLTTC